MNLWLFLKLSKLFQQNGYSLYLVGGSVRDYLLYHKFSDMDVATDATIFDMEKFLIFEEKYVKLNSGKFIFNNNEIDVTTLRKEGGYLDYRHPANVAFVKTPYEDYSRRDFTINALYLDGQGNILDYVDGISDLKGKKIKMIGDSFIRLQEDPLRILRALRFAYNLSFSLDKNLLNCIKKQKFLLKKINYVKIREELYKFNASPSTIRTYLKRFKIDQVIPLYYERINKKDFQIDKTTPKLSLGLLSKLQYKHYMGQFILMKCKYKAPSLYLKNIYNQINEYYKFIDENFNFAVNISSYFDFENIINLDKRGFILVINLSNLKYRSYDFLNEFIKLKIQFLKIDATYFISDELNDNALNLLMQINKKGFIIYIDDLKISQIKIVNKLITKPLIINQIINDEEKKLLNKNNLYLETKKDSNNYLKIKLFIKNYILK